MILPFGGCVSRPTLGHSIISNQYYSNFLMTQKSAGHYLPNVAVHLPNTANKVSDMFRFVFLDRRNINNET